MKLCDNWRKERKPTESIFLFGIQLFGLLVPLQELNWMRNVGSYFLNSSDAETRETLNL